MLHGNNGDLRERDRQTQKETDIQRERQTYPHRERVKVGNTKFIEKYRYM